MRFWRLACVLAVLAPAACDSYDAGPTGPAQPSLSLEPRDLVARYEWVLEGWDGLEPVGHPAVEVSWLAPTGWRGEAFRVYAKRSSSVDYALIATVTGCTVDGLCVYSDANVLQGRQYDYFVATLDEAGREAATDDAVRVDVPVAAEPAAPAAPRATALDGAVYLQWPSAGAERYQVFLESLDGASVFFLLGETDGTGFVDERAENGRSYGYRIAAISAEGRHGRRSEIGAAVPRPDYHAELIHAWQDDAASSGFRFVGSEADSPIVDGGSASAQWRLEDVGGALSLVPLGDTRVSAGTFTTALSCGPGSEADCVAVDRAPAASALGAAPVAVEPGFTYVFRVRGEDGRPHFGKVRVQGAGTDSQGRRLVVFDWAYQLLPDEPSLLQTGG